MSCIRVTRITFRILYVVIAFSLVPAAVYAKCDLQKVAAFDLNLEHGVPLVGVTINGQHGLMMFSNRSNATILYGNSIDQLSLKSYPTEYFRNDNGKPAPILGVHIDQFKIGDTKPISVDLFVALATSNPDVWGVISTSFFPGDAIEYDLPHKKINIYNEKYCLGRALAYWDDKANSVDLNKEDLATFSGEIDGKPIRIQINSSQYRSTVNEAAVKLANLALRDDPSLVPIDIGIQRRDDKDFNAYFHKLAKIHEIIIAGEVIRDVDLRTIPNPTIPSIPGEALGGSRTYDSPTNIQPKITLGGDYLRTHHIIMSPNQRLAFITPTSASPFDTTLKP